jgi:hypothetical protein
LCGAFLSYSSVQSLTTKSRTWSRTWRRWWAPTQWRRPARGSGPKLRLLSPLTTILFIEYLDSQRFPLLILF